MAMNHLEGNTRAVVGAEGPQPVAHNSPQWAEEVLQSCQSRSDNGLQVLGETGIGRWYDRMFSSLWVEWLRSTGMARNITSRRTLLVSWGSTSAQIFCPAHMLRLALASWGLTALNCIRV